ncbi:MAG: hypothetical protein NTY06_01430 [Candidatus Gottesmanbacteria bacterium]|nr:hypothetical protein [Candidatus Gottesmanbacteria bacterium]
MKKSTAQIVRDELKKIRLDTIAEKIDQIDEAVHIIKENEQNLKDLGNLKGRLDLLDKIYITVDKIAGEVTSYREQQELNSAKLVTHGDRIEKIEKHLHFPAAP